MPNKLARERWAAFMGLTIHMTYAKFCDICDCVLSSPETVRDILNADTRSIHAISQTSTDDFVTLIERMDNGR